MELKTYLQILRRKWWIVIPIFLITLGATALFTYSQPLAYQASTTLIVRLGAAFNDARSQVSALDTLSNRAQIVSTYAEIANSRLIKGQAITDLNLASDSTKGLTIDARAIAGTNIIEITVQGSDPNVVGDFANAVAAKTVTYVKSLYESFELESLDEATAPHSPLSTNRTLYLALGVIFGLAVSIGVAILAEYLQLFLSDVTFAGSEFISRWKKRVFGRFARKSAP